MVQKLNKYVLKKKIKEACPFIRFKIIKDDINKKKSGFYVLYYENNNKELMKINDTSIIINNVFDLNIKIYLINSINIKCYKDYLLFRIFLIDYNYLEFELSY